MEAELIEKQAVNATFKVTVPAAEVDAAFDKVLHALARQVKVPGFRPGRAPRGVLERRVGRDALEEEVQETLVDGNYPDAVRELDLTPVHAHFHGDAPKEGQPFTFEVHAELYPEVELPDLDAITIDVEARELTDAMIDETVDRLRNEHATLVPVEREAQATDYVLLESLAPEGENDGDEPKGTGSVQPVDMEVASEEVRSQLLGKTMGEAFELKLTDSYAAKEGEEPETRTLRMVVKDLKAKEKPEIDDDFAKTLGFDSWDEARQGISASLRNQLDRETFEAQREAFLDALLEATTFEIPASLLQRRQRNLLQDLAEDLGQQGMTLERYLAQLEESGNKEEFENELTEAARKGVTRDLVLERLQEVRGTEVTDEEFDEAVRYQARRQRQDPARFRREMGERWLTNYRFLLARDKALRELVRERVGGAAELDPEATQAAYEEAAAGAAADEDEAGDEGPEHEHEHE